MRSPDTVSHSTVCVFCAPSVQGLQSRLYHCNTQSSGEYVTSNNGANITVKISTAHHQQGWQQQQLCSPQGSLIETTRRKEQDHLCLFCPGYSGWQRGGSRWWRKEHPYKKRKIRQTIAVSHVKFIAVGWLNSHPFDRSVLPEQCGTEAFVQPSNALFPQ